MRASRRIALIAALAAVALTIFVAESQIPPFLPIPGVKLGLANIVTLVAMVILNRRDALAILLVRLVLGAAFTGGFSRPSSSRSPAGSPPTPSWPRWWGSSRRSCSGW